MTETLEISQEKRPFGLEICRQIIERIKALGFPEPLTLNLPNFDDAKFSLVTDPFTQSKDLVGYWYDANQQRIGQIKFHGDGSFYAEYDVVQPHPKKPRFFVEAINAWGRENNIKTEPILLELPQ